MLIKHNRRGFTLAEAVTVIGIMVIVVACTVSMMMGSMRCYDSATNRAFTDTDAVLAMQKIVSDVREAKTVSITGGGASLLISFPKTTTDGYYDRREADPDNVVEYYLSDHTGHTGRTGTWLWRELNHHTFEAMKKDVASMLFETDTSRSVKITIITQNRTHTGVKRTELTQRVVYLRNY